LTWKRFHEILGVEIERKENVRFGSLAEGYHINETINASKLNAQGGNVECLHFNS